ncbi:hypothetical protein ACWEKT_38530 [Nocardia takedensis]
MFTALGWEPGIRLEVTALDAGVLLARPAPEGSVTFADGRYFRVPYRARRRVRLAIGDRVLLIAHRTSRRLVIHPPTVLDELCAPSLAVVSEADA